MTSGQRPVTGNSRLVTDDLDLREMSLAPAVVWYGQGPHPYFVSVEFKRVAERDSGRNATALRDRTPSCLKAI
jgi:hypothetical protein